MTFEKCSSCMHVHARTCEQLLVCIQVACHGCQVAVQMVTFSPVCRLWIVTSRYSTRNWTQCAATAEATSCRYSSFRQFWLLRTVGKTRGLQRTLTPLFVIQTLAGFGPHSVLA